MKHPLTLWRRNCRSIRLTWGKLDRVAMDQLKSLTMKYSLSVAAGDLQRLNGRWYVTHSGLIAIAQRRRCSGIRTTILKSLSDPVTSRWVFKAIVYKAPRSQGFVGYGDADPSNTSALVRGAEMRVAETRAVNRALRKAFGIGFCSIEELGSQPSPFTAPKGEKVLLPNSNGFANGEPKLRDKLCLLIRKYELDPVQVKRYAADFCGTQEIREASRGLVESFVSHLSEWAARDRAGLICKLNSFAQSQEVHS